MPVSKILCRLPTSTYRIVCLFFTFYAHVTLLRCVESYVQVVLRYEERTFSLCNVGNILFDYPNWGVLHINQLLKRTTYTCCVPCEQNIG